MSPERRRFDSNSKRRLTDGHLSLLETVNNMRRAGNAVTKMNMLRERGRISSERSSSTRCCLTSSSLLLSYHNNYFVLFSRNRFPPLFSCNHFPRIITSSRPFSCNCSLLLYYRFSSLLGRLGRPTTRDRPVQIRYRQLAVTSVTSVVI